jgi:MFS family permease
MYDDRAAHAQPADAPEIGRVTFRNVLAFQNFILMMGVIFGLQFVDRSFGPVLPLYVEQVGVTPARVPLVSGTLFSIMALTGALGHHFCGRLLKRYSSRMVISGGAALAAAGSALFGLGSHVWVMFAASLLLGIGIGAAMTASFSAAGSVIPPGAHGAGFGVLASASLVGMASSPFIAGFLGGTSIRIVFLVDLAMMALLAAVVHRTMTDTAPGREAVIEPETVLGP